jgi:hypothetical protein
MIISANQNGFSNRLKSWASAMYLAEEGGDNVSVCWSTNRLVGAEFEDLFENDVSIECDESFFCKVFKFWFLVTDKEDDPIDFQYHNTPPKYLIKYRDFFRSIKPKEKFIKKANDYPNDMVAVLARTWPECNHRGGNARAKYLFDVYLEEMSQLDGPFFLSSDSEEFVKKAKDEFGKRIITQNRRSPYGKRHKSGVIESFIDMLIASRQSLIIGDAMSTFNEVAWWMGDCKPIVKLVNIPDLDKLGMIYKTDKASFYKFRYTHDYFNIVYTPILEKLRLKSLKILEIGVRKGSSLRVWKDYFRHGIVYGIDIDKETMIEDEPRIKTFLADQTDKEALQKIAQKYGPFDIIIDDGSHWYEHQIISFFSLWDFVKPGGFYFIEDVMDTDKFGGEPVWETFLISDAEKVLFNRKKPEYESVQFFRNLVCFKKITKNLVQLHKDCVPLFLVSLFFPLNDPLDSHWCYLESRSK